MKKYSVKKPGKDFQFLNINYNAKGTREKKSVIDSNGKFAFFKYEGVGYLVSESCSEKMCYEIAKVLGYECAKIELAVDSDGVLGILNYSFVNKSMSEHMDAVSFLNPNGDERSKYYTISNIKDTLDKMNKDLFIHFIQLMIFDALVGEQDRHEENWGVEFIDGKYRFSPLYDNGCSLLKEFKNEKCAIDYYTGKKSFDSYILRSKTYIYSEDHQKKYKHFELIKYLYGQFPDIVEKEVLNLNILTDEVIEKIVQQVPDYLLTDKHKEFIIIYLKKRRDLLLNII